MYCKKCGGKVESYASHCPFCGEAMGGNDVTATYTTSIPVQRTHSHKNIGRWILTYFLMNLPVVGIIMLFVWAFGAKSKEDPTFRNWAKTMLIFQLLIAAILVVYIVILAPMVAEILAELSSIPLA
jgi:uncharacterized membrane protein YvbJ